MNKTKIAAIALAAIMVVGTLGLSADVFAEKNNDNGNGETPNGVPFQSLQEQIDAVEADFQAELDALQAEIDALSVDVDANADAIAALEAELANKQSLIDGTCTPGSSIREVNPDGSVVCEVDDVAAGAGSLSVVRVFSTTEFLAAGVSFESDNVQCPAGTSVVGGGFQTNIGPEVDQSYPSGNGWTAVFNSLETGGNHRVWAMCASVN